MQTKGIVFIMIVPIFFIAMAAYIEKNPLITGAVTAQQDAGAEMSGIYSVMPSFKAKVEYSPSDYAELKNNLVKIIDECKMSDEIESCLKEKSGQLGWECPDNEVSVLYDFVEKFNECLNLKDDNVVCRFSFDEKPWDNKIFNIKLNVENQKIKVSLISDTNILDTSYISQENIVYTSSKNAGGDGTKSSAVNIVIRYSKGKPEVLLASANEGESTSIIELSKMFLLYKSNGNVKFVELGEENLFRNPITNKIIDLPKIKGVKFCAKGRKKIDNSDLIYKFAVTFPNPAEPPAIKSLTAADKEKAESSIVLKWGKAKLDDGSDVADIDHYNIYCSKSSLEDKASKSISTGNLKPTVGIRSDTNYEEWITELKKCGTDLIEDDVDYYFAVTAVSRAKKEGKVSIQAIAKSIDDLAPGAMDIVLLNSNGAREQKSYHACIELPKTNDQGTPGLIWAGFFIPQKNEDGVTELRKADELKYYLHFSKQDAPGDNLDKCADKKCVELSYPPKDNQNGAQPELSLRQFSRFREIESTNHFFEEGQLYCFTVVARDKGNNIIKTLPNIFEKPKQWEEMESKPVAIWK